jgi:ribonucleoside-diphosphate reductase alpha chain
VPLQFLIDKFKNVRFEPSGWTGDKDIPYAKSIVDFIFQWLEKKFPNEDVPAPPPVWEEPLLEARPAQSAAADAPLCSECGALMVPSGKCHACRSCGSTSGCS